MSTIPEIRNPLLRGGVNSDDRLEQALEPSYAKVEERTETDFLEFGSVFAKAVQFYDLNDIPQGDWQAFFDSEVSNENPQRALFIAFLRLLNFLHEHTNTLTKRHLDYYYKEVLDFTEEQAKPSQVHLFFEVAQNVERYLLEEAEELRAGTDSEGKNVLFRMVRDLVINNVEVAELKTVFREDDALFNRMYAAPIANSKDGNGEELDENSAGWNPFGKSQLKASVDANFGSTVQRNMNDARVGFAISSPYLRLPEGERKVTITLHFEDNLYTTPPEFKNALRLSYSNESEWIALEPASVKVSRSANKLKWELFLKKDDASWDDYDTATHGGSIDSIHPVLKFELMHETAEFGYAKLKDLRLRKYDVQVAVNGVRSLLIQNDYSTLDVTKPFLPFGAVPGVGDSLYVGHQEIFRHELQELRVNVNWKEVPGADLAERYLNYHEDITVGSGFNNNFTWSIDWLEDKQFQPVVSPLQNLFETDARDQNTISVQRVTTNSNVFVRKRKEQAITEYDYNVPYGYLRFRLEGPNLPYFRGFGHYRYPIAVTKANGAVEVEPPWSPEILSLTLDYKTEVETVELNTAEERTDRFFHLAPFGENEVHAQLQGGIHFKLLPQFNSQGYLYMGLNGVNAPESVAVLFQLAEGSGNAEESFADTGITWEYLSSAGWNELSASRLSSDSTRNLLHSGIITFDLPSDVATAHTLMPTGLVWLRAQIPTNAEGIDLVEGIHAQAGLAEFFDQDNATDFLENRLEADTISALDTSNTSVRSVTQPYSSFDGAPPENDEAFYTRVSERLRHKDRAIMIHDYERLVMEKFDSIYKTKCLNHTNDVTELKAGSVRVVVVPNLRKHHANNRFQPKAGQRKLLDIQDYLAARITPFIDLKVWNPLYEQIRLHFNVGFHPGFDAGFYGKQLHDELQRFLSPWAFEEGEDLVFGGKVYKSSILKFIEDREYVDFVNDFTMFHIYCDDTQDAAIEQLSVAPDQAIYHIYGSHSVVKFMYEDVFGRTLMAELDLRFFKGLNGNITDHEEALVRDLKGLFNSKDRKEEEITLNYLKTVLKSFYYVEEVKSASLKYILPDNLIMEDVETAITKTSRSIIVTANAHRLAVYRSGDFNCEGNMEIGIGFMVVDADFYVD